MPSTRNAQRVFEVWEGKALAEPKISVLKGRAIARPRREKIGTLLLRPIRERNVASAFSRCKVGVG